MTDQHLLQQYAATNADDAFSQLVERHKHWLYSVCLRQLKNPHTAEDATQAVFIALARSAAALQHHPCLTGWLYKAARFVSANLQKRAARRSKHEMEAARMTPLSTPEEFSPIVPDLERILDRLPKKYRLPLLLRFYQQKTFAQIAADLNISEPAAQKRVLRALDRLRARLALPESATLSTLLLTHLLHPTPPTLTAPVITASLTAAAGPAFTLSQGILKMMLFTKLKTAAIVATAALFLLFGAALFHYLFPQSKDVSLALAEIPAPATLPALPEKTSALLAPYLTAETSVVIHLDGSLVDTGALQKFVEDALADLPPQKPADLQNLHSQIAMLRLLADSYLARFKQLGGRHVYYIAPFIINTNPPHTAAHPAILVGPNSLLLVQLETNSDIKGLSNLLSTIPHLGKPFLLNDRFLAFHDSDSDKTTAIKNSIPRPDLAAALDAGATGPLQIAFTLPDSARTALPKLDPTLPPEFGSLSTDLFYKNFQYGYASLHLPPDADFTVAARYDSHQHALLSTRLWNQFIAAQIKEESSVVSAPALESLQLLTAQTQCDSTILHLDTAQIRREVTIAFLLPLLAQQNQPATTPAAQ